MNKCRSSTYSTSFTINNNKVSNNISSNKKKRNNFNMFYDSCLAKISSSLEAFIVYMTQNSYICIAKQQILV